LSPGSISPQALPHSGGSGATPTPVNVGLFPGGLESAVGQQSLGGELQVMLPGPGFVTPEVAVVAGGGEPGGPELLGAARIRLRGTPGAGWLRQAGWGATNSTPITFSSFPAPGVGGRGRPPGQWRRLPPRRRRTGAGHLQPENAGNAPATWPPEIRPGAGVPQAEKPGVALQTGQAGLNFSSWDLAPKPGRRYQAVLPAGILQFA